MVLKSEVELAEYFGLSRQTVHQWVARREYNGFPEPADEGKARNRVKTKLYDVLEVENWRATYVPKPGRPPGAPRDSHGQYISSKK